MQFVKASERLPELDTILCLKFKGMYCSGQFNKRYSKHECDIAWRGTYTEASFDLIEWLDESIPVSITDQAKKLYPYPEAGKYSQIDESYLEDRASLQRQAHITCARMYTGEIEKGREAVDILKALCALKRHKDTVGKDKYYETAQPEVWKIANRFIEKHNL